MHYFSDNMVAAGFFIPPIGINIIPSVGINLDDSLVFQGRITQSFIKDSLWNPQLPGYLGLLTMSNNDDSPILTN